VGLFGDERWDWTLPGEVLDHAEPLHHSQGLDPDLEEAFLTSRCRRVRAAE